MNWPPIAIRQESKAGLNDPAPDVLVACWAQQVVGFVFPPVSTMTGATLQFVVPDDGVTRQVAVSVELCEVVGETSYNAGTDRIDIAPEDPVPTLVTLIAQRDAGLGRGVTG